MTDESLEGLTIEQPDTSVDVEFQKFNCYGVRLNEDQVIITVNNKNVRKFQKSDFPADVNFNDVSHIGKMISLVRDGGLIALIETFDLTLE